MESWSWSQEVGSGIGVEGCAWGGEQVERWSHGVGVGGEVGGRMAQGLESKAGVKDWEGGTEASL